MHQVSFVHSVAAMLLAVAVAGCATAPAKRSASKLFDAPLGVETVPLPKDPLNPQMTPHITCSRYPGFMVKEIDLGEKGAQKLAILPKESPCEADAPNEVLVSNLIEGYFKGVKGDYVFFDASDGWDGGVPFYVFSPGGQKLFDDSAVDGEFQAIQLNGKSLLLRFTRVFHADCSLYLDQNICAQRTEQASHLGGEGASPSLMLPDCTKAYESELKKTAAIYVEDLKKSPSVLRYPVELTFDGEGAPFILPTGAKPVTCHVPS